MTHSSEIVNELPYASPGDPGWKPRSATHNPEAVIEGEEIVPVVAGLAAVGSAADMANKLGAFAERRRVVLDYISANFVKGVDFGPTDDRSDKPTLKKPGAEKLCRLFNTTPRWRRDTETWEMLGSPAGTICYICEIVDNVTGAIIGEGRGAYIYVIEGSASLDGQDMATGDAAKVTDQSGLRIHAREQSELILVDVPMTFEPVGIWKGRI